MKHAGKAHAARGHTDRPLSPTLQGKLDNKMIGGETVLVLFN